MNKILVYIYPTFSEFEITIATAVLKKHYDICTVASEDKVIAGESGLQFHPHCTLETVDVRNFEAIIIPGGDLIHVVNDAALLEVVKKFDNQNKLIAAICSGPYVLAKAGLLQATTYTCTLSKEQRDFLGVFSQENFRYEKVLSERNLVTAQGHAYVEFGLTILEKLQGKRDQGTVDFYTGKGNRLMEREA